MSAKGWRAINLVARQAVAAIVDALDPELMVHTRISAVDPVLVEAFDSLTGRAARASRSFMGWSRSDDTPEDDVDFVLDSRDEKELSSRRRWRDQLRAYLENEVPPQIRAELPSVATRLIGKEQALFDQYDRLRAEAEFRMSLVPPVAALSAVVTVIAFQWGPVLIATMELFALANIGMTALGHESGSAVWKTVAETIAAVAVAAAIFVWGGLVLLDQSAVDIGAAFLTVLLLLGLTAAIFGQGAKIQRAAGDLLADAIFVGRVESPLLERLKRAAGVPTVDGGAEPSTVTPS